MKFDRTKKYYTFAMELYKDSMTYDYKKIVDYIAENWQEWGLIEHQPEQDEKKVHTHVLVHFPNKRYISAISKEIGLAENYIQPANYIPYMRYLIHLDNEEKIQYSVDDVVGPIANKLRAILLKGTLSEEEQVAVISDYIFESTCKLTYASLTQYVLQTGTYSCFRRNYHFFKDLMLEKNSYM